jgi:acetyl-CoA carboxylase biotin carboxyl carrier protein
MPDIVATMAGTVFKVLVKPNDQVQPGQDVVVIESMKMEIPLQSETAGIVADVKVKEGEFVNEGGVLITLK